ncbi:hypothetical protein BgAZ_105250 [Babesia gibsoni]|uniref:Uncharacterized protein n=1 Tax=Babesia gibsoni TaxID=33632 RepID=A0AAD8PG07_BABGI|nr:hypothetical protein BgAZ_105250 [Babesia gibsoni]
MKRLLCNIVIFNWIGCSLVGATLLNKGDKGDHGNLVELDTLTWRQEKPISSDMICLSRICRYSRFTVDKPFSISKVTHSSDTVYEGIGFKEAIEVRVLSVWFKRLYSILTNDGIAFSVFDGSSYDMVSESRFAEICTETIAIGEVANPIAFSNYYCLDLSFKSPEGPAPVPFVRLDPIEAASTGLSLEESINRALNATSCVNFTGEPRTEQDSTLRNNYAVAS